jgi:hypothetical protein
MIGQHGRDCPKIGHLGGGYLHTDNDDRPYDVDGIWYCGRCHCWLGVKEPIEYSTSVEGAKQ